MAISDMIKRENIGLKLHNSDLILVVSSIFFSFWLERILHLCFYDANV